ncbi:2,3-butanediol dehydrogenase [Peribacillus simplex]|uniref:2,3-butanediol dehydrogenase n=1 Tax=Peribacillus simplex TaxID=1478 RepID=UPI0010BEAF8F|nr:2,3-butanediol dehydrogenase [Peribacillus simplex]TKH03459.1 2,3-butanediol dehydrogenase [Peribacillus simplex]
MKAAVWHDIRKVQVEEVKEPKIEPGMVKISVKWCGICGTDLHEYLAGPIFLPTEPHPLTDENVPLILGHEFSGEVIEVGEGVSRVKVGDRVAVEPILSCGTCNSCKNGRYNTCDKIGFHGLSGGGGGFSETTMVKEAMVHKIPNNMTYEQGALVEPTAVAVHAVRESNLRAGDTCVVFGTGPIGLLVIQAAKLAGASCIIAVEISEERQKMARELGVHYTINPLKEDVVQTIHQITDGGADVCFEVTGVEPCINYAINSSKTDGQVIVVSIWESPVSIHLNHFVLKERQLKGAMCYRDIFPAVIQLISEGRLEVNPLITRKINLNNIAEEGFDELVKNKSHIKILVSPESK